ncbi:MAG: hypothetical protein V4717_08290 [Bacteroidota bacterium]
METIQDGLPDMQDLKARKNFITKPAAQEMNRKYKTFRKDLKKEESKLSFIPPHFPLAITYGKEALTKLMEQAGCEGVRIYPGINKENELTLVFVGINAGGHNMDTTESFNTEIDESEEAAPPPPVIVDEGQMSPPYPAQEL